MDTPELDQEGYLLDPAAWDEALAERFAAEESIALDPVHWAVIRFMRAYYEEHQVPPDVRHVTRELAGQLGPDPRKALFDLFPYGYVKQACRIAGMRKPRIWSTG